MRKIEWHYRVIGPFAAPDYARGGYSVALALRALSPRHDSEITWSTGLKLGGALNCEVDFLAWYRHAGMLRREAEEPVLLVGEAKSFGKNAFDEKSISSLKALAGRFPGCFMVVSSLRNISEYPPEELARLKELAIWGRRDRFNGEPINPLIILTEVELHAEYSIHQAWKKIDGEAGEFSQYGYVDPYDMHKLSEWTQRRYLGLPWPWEYPGYKTEKRARIASLLKRSQYRIVRALKSRG